MTEKEIWEAVPEEYQDKIYELAVRDEFIQSVEWHIGFFTNGEETFLNSTKRSHKNFAAFMYSAFNWTGSPFKFNWWFETVFGYEFKHPIGSNEDGHHGRHTNTTVAIAIENYKKNDGCDRRFDMSEEYTETDSFLDAYSDGFSPEEDERYFGGCDDNNDW